ncbi:MAG: hypothetical protein K5652_00645 [Bacteroidales bacterium]|nr:hypothetical protein [Bacteroidales bacterium]
MRHLLLSILLIFSISLSAKGPVSRGYGYVDLGLSVRWATCNLGASSPEKAGNYYAWGETAVKDSCTAWNYRWCEGFYWNAAFSKYGSVDGILVLDPSDDAAKVAWGGKWRIPTHEEQEELRSKCSWSWIDDYKGSGVKGYVVKSKVPGYEGRSIFLPAAGDKLGTVIRSYGIRGYYMSSSMIAGDDNGACTLLFEKGSTDWMYCYRYYGQSVRAVLAR